MRVDDHRIKVWQKFPEEVYHPAKSLTPDQKLEEDRIVRGVPTIFDTMMENNFVHRATPKKEE